MATVARQVIVSSAQRATAIKAVARIILQLDRTACQLAQRIRAMAPAIGAVERVIGQLDRAGRQAAPASGQLAPGIRAMPPVIGAVERVIRQLDRAGRQASPVIVQCPLKGKNTQILLKNRFFIFKP